MNKVSEGSAAGTNAVGIIDAIGSSVSGFKVGDSVFVSNSNVWSDNITVPSTSASKVPISTPEEAAIIPSLLSAWGILNNYESLKSGDNVLLLNSTDAIGQAVIHVGKLLELNIIQITDKNIHSDEIKTKLKALNNIKLSITNTPGKLSSDLLKYVNKYGSLVFYSGPIRSVLAGDVISMSVSASVFEQKSINGFDLTTWIQTNPASYNKGIQFINDNLKKVTLKPKVYKYEDFLKGISAVQETGELAVLKV